ncbi:MAG: flippase [Chloroflexi bacterium]|nr:flippase [Chloroflexota bacterium]
MATVIAGGSGSGLAPSLVDAETEAAGKVLSDPGTPRADHRVARLVASNTFAQLVARGAIIVAAIGANAMLSRYLGPSAFGRYSLVFAYVGVVSGIFANWGLGSIAVRDASQKPRETEPILTSAAAMQLLASAGSYAVLLLLVRVAAHGQDELAVAVAGVTLLLMPVDILAMALQVQMKLVRVAFASIAGALLKLGAAAGAVGLGWGVTGIITSTIVATVVGYGLLILVLRGCLDWSRLRPQAHRYRPLLAEAWPLAVATVFVTLVNQMPLILLGKLATAEQVGYFSAANKVASQLVVVPLVLSTSLYPVFSRLALEDRASLGRMLSRTLRYMTILAMLLVVLGAATGPWSIQVLYGPLFRPAVPVLLLLVAQSALLYPAILAGEALVALGRQRTNLVIQVSGAVVVTFGCVALSHLYGAVGAAVASLAGYVVVCVCTIVVAHRTLRGCLRVRWLAQIGASLGFLAGLLIVGRFLPLTRATAVALVFYGLLLFALRVLDQRDIRLARLVLAVRRAGDYAEPMATHGK